MDQANGGDSVGPTEAQRLLPERAEPPVIRIDLPPPPAPPAAPSPYWRRPLVWFLLGILLAAMIALVVALAATAGGDSDDENEDHERREPREHSRVIGWQRGVGYAARLSEEPQTKPGV